MHIFIILLHLTFLLYINLQTLLFSLYLQFITHEVFNSDFHVCWMNVVHVEEWISFILLTLNKYGSSSIYIWEAFSKLLHASFNFPTRSYKQNNTNDIRRILQHEYSVIQAWGISYIIFANIPVIVPSNKKTEHLNIQFCHFPKRLKRELVYKQFAKTNNTYIKINFFELIFFLVQNFGSISIVTILKFNL
jgi:hypothetical protein